MVQSSIDLHLQGVQVLSEKSNILVRAWKNGTISKVFIFSGPLMMHNLFYMAIRGHSKTMFTLRGASWNVNFTHKVLSKNMSATGNWLNRVSKSINTVYKWSFDF